MAISKTGIHVDSDPNFTNPLVYEENGQVNSVTADSLTPSTRYYTKGYVVADGQTVYSGNTLSFKTADLDYFTIANEYAGTNTITLTKNGSPNNIVLEYTTDDGDHWTALDMTGITANSWQLGEGVKLKFRGNNSGFSAYANRYYHFSSSNAFSVNGDLMSIFDRTIIRNTLPAFTFYGLFERSEVIDAGGLYMSGITILDDWSFEGVFYECFNLISSPDLSNITGIGERGLSATFQFTSLSICPDLSNVTTIGVRGFYSCFHGCNLLTKGADLTNVTNIGRDGLYHIYAQCEQLNDVTAPNINDLTANGVLSYWLSNAGTSATGTKVVRVPTGATINTNSDSGIPSGWTRIDY